MQFSSLAESFSLIGSLTSFGQFLGSATGPGASSNGLAESPLWARLDHCQSDADSTMPARVGLASMYRRVFR